MTYATVLASVLGGFPGWKQSCRAEELACAAPESGPSTCDRDSQSLDVLANIEMPQSSLEYVLPATQGFDPEVTRSWLENRTDFRQAQVRFASLRLNASALYAWLAFRQFFYFLDFWA